jgi:hypothetical protein
VMREFGEGGDSKDGDDRNAVWGSERETRWSGGFGERAIDLQPTKR